MVNGIQLMAGPSALPSVSSQSRLMDADVFDQVCNLPPPPSVPADVKSKGRDDITVEKGKEPTAKEMATKPKATAKPKTSSGDAIAKKAKPAVQVAAAKSIPIAEKNASCPMKALESAAKGKGGLPEPIRLLLEKEMAMAAPAPALDNLIIYGRPQKAKQDFALIGSATPQMPQKGVPMDGGVQRGQVDNTPKEIQEWQRKVWETWEAVVNLDDGEEDEDERLMRENQLVDGETGVFNFSPKKREADAQKAKAAKNDQKSTSKASRAASLFSWGRSKAQAAASSVHNDKAKETSEEGGVAGLGGYGGDLPKTFPEMMLWNAKMTGANPELVEMVIAHMQVIVKAVCSNDDANLELESNLLALRITELVGDKTSIMREFRVCLLSSLRSLLPRIWSADHEQGWVNAWDALEAKMSVSMTMPAKFRKAVTKHLDSLPPNKMRKVCDNVFKRLFAEVPDTENYFKQNNERLIMIATKAFEITSRLYKQPTQTIKDVNSLGLRHIMMNIPAKHFPPFANAAVMEMKEACDDMLALEGIAWGVAQIASLMTRTILENGNPLIHAVLANNPKAVKKALQSYGREERMSAPL